MDENRFPLRKYSKGDEPEPDKSINYYAGNNDLYNALSAALAEDEWEELLNSPLGVILRFHSLNFGWASRMVHYILTAQLVCEKPFEIWSLIGCKPMRFSLLEFEAITSLNCDDVANLDNPGVEVNEEMEEYWTLLGVDVKRGPSVSELIEACRLCEDWTRLDRIRLGYLCIYAGYIEAKKESTPINVKLARLVMDVDAFRNYPWGRVAMKFLMKSVKDVELSNRSYVIEGFAHVLQVWVYYALPDFAVTYGEPYPSRRYPPLLAFKGGRGKRNIKENMYKQVNVNICVMKDEYAEMFPRWDDDVQDVHIDNIIDALGQEGWKWSRAHWQVMGVLASGNDKRKRGTVVKSENTCLTLSLTSAVKRSRDETYSAVDIPSLVKGLQEHFDQQIKDLSDKVDSGFSQCAKRLKVIGHAVGSIQKRMDAVTQAVPPGNKEAEQSKEAAAAAENLEEDKAKEAEQSNQPAAAAENLEEDKAKEAEQSNQPAAAAENLEEDKAKEAADETKSVTAVGVSTHSKPTPTQKRSNRHKPK